MSLGRRCLLLAPTGGSRQHSKMSAMEGKPDARLARPAPLLRMRFVALEKTPEHSSTAVLRAKLLPFHGVPPVEYLRAVHLPIEYSMSVWFSLKPDLGSKLPDARTIPCIPANFPVPPVMYPTCVVASFPD